MYPLFLCGDWLYKKWNQEGILFLRLSLLIQVFQGTATLKIVLFILIK